MTLIPAFIYRRIAHRPNLVRIVDNIGWLFFDKLLRMGVGLLVGVWVARYLGPEQFGLLNFALAFTGLFGAIATLGLPGIVVRDIVRDPENAQVTLGTAAVLQLIGGLVAYVLMLVAIVYVRPDDALLRSIVAILGAMMLLKASEIAVYWFESQVQSKYTVWVQNSVFLVFAAVKVLLILQQASLIAFVWVMFAEALVIAMILLVIMGQHGPTLRSLRVSIERSTALLRDSWPLILSAIAVTVYMKIDQIMLGQMIDDEAVGVYSASTRISELWYFIPIIIVSSLFPEILKAKKNKIIYEEKIVKLFRFLIIVSILVAVIICLTSAEIVFIIFGNEYSESKNVLIVHIWTGIFVSIGLVSGKWFLAENKQFFSLQITIMAALTNIILNIIIIPYYNATGAAIATFISYAVSNLVWPAIFKETRPLLKLIFKSMFLEKNEKH